MIDLGLIFKALYFFFCIGLGYIPASFSRRFKSILALFFGLIIAYSSLYSYYMGHDLIKSLLFTTFVLSFSSFLLFHGRGGRESEMERRIENIEDKVKAIFMVLKTNHISNKEFDLESFFRKYGEKWRKVKEDRWFEYYEVYGKGTKYLIKVDKESRIPVDYKRISKCDLVFNVLKTAVPIAFIVILGVYAWMGSKVPVDFASMSYKLASPVLPSFIHQEVGNCSKQPLEILTQIYPYAVNKSFKIVSPNPPTIFFNVNGDNITIVVKDLNKTHKKIEVYENGVYCGWIPVSSSMSLLGGG